jgi:hypothetical protein
MKSVPERQHSISDTGTESTWPVGFQKSACASQLCDWSARATGHDRVPCRCVCST